MPVAAQWAFKVWACVCGVGSRIFLAALFLCVASFSTAQIDRAGLSGTVTDPAGRVLPETRVTALQIATTLRRTAVSSGVGTYDIPELPVGTYTITFEHQGFKTLTF